MKSFTETMCPAGAGRMISKPAPRLLITGTGSGCGKTTVTLAISQAFKNRGLDVAAFKCGPDYIDPMFTSEIVGAASANIDLFFCERETVTRLFLRHSADINLIEGAMGYYDGLSFENEVASAWDTACALNAPAVLTINSRGMGRSVAAMIKGYLHFVPESRIEGVVLNRVSAGIFPRLKALVEKECDLRVLGYLPECPGCSLESRHLGLVTAAETADLQGKLTRLAAQAEETIDLDGLIKLMRAQPPLTAVEHVIAPVGQVRIAVARDAAFCFYYRDNLELLEALGAQLVPFSPLHDAHLPDCAGLILGGGYPELHAEALSRNKTMLNDIRAAVADGMPTIAECGGFMMLTRAIGGRSMAGALDATCENQGRLTRFGYVTLTARTNNLLLRAGEHIRGHEFHYWDADDAGNALRAEKPGGRGWDCCFATDTLYAGFPHLYLPSNPGAAERFVCKCLKRSEQI